MSRVLVSGLMAFLLGVTGLPTSARPVAYTLDAANSVVGFTVAFGPDEISGTIPVAGADVMLDLDRVANSTVSVALDAPGAVASFPFATQALRGPKVLAVEDFPRITFASRSVRLEGDGARMDGDITIRGQTRPITLAAQIYRQRGQPEGDRSRLSILLEGALSRRDFGATGWSDLVGDTVNLRILVRIEATR